MGKIVFFSCLFGAILTIAPVFAASYKVDHAKLIKEAKPEEGKKLYNQVCVTCHGTIDKEGSLPTAMRFANGQFKNGKDPRSMYKTLTKGFNLMVPQNWLTPEQKYHVIAYIREHFVKQHNDGEYFNVDEAYLASLKTDTVQGQKPKVIDLKKRYKLMDYGPNMNYTFEIEGRENIVYKAMVVRLDKGEGGVATGSAWMMYDQDLMRVAAIWTGNEFTDWRSIGMDGSHQTHPKIKGQNVLINPKMAGWADPKTGQFKERRIVGRDKRYYGPLPHDWSQYHGMYHYDDKVIFDYSVGGVRIYETPGLEMVDSQAIFTRTLNIAASDKPLRMLLSRKGIKVAFKSSLTSLKITEENGLKILEIPAHNSALSLKVFMSKDADVDSHASKSSAGENLSAYFKGGKRRWNQLVETDGKNGPEKFAYTIDEITGPMENPWNSWMRMSGFDFFKDGKRAAVSTWHGDVWIVSGINNKLGKLSWQRIATGLFQPLGVRIIDDTIYVNCRDQIAILRDYNGDGETDYYECFNNDHQVTEHFHEFAMGLQSDDKGDFYYAKSACHARLAVVPHHGTLIKVSKDGKTSEILANGFRAANGVCLNDDGSFFVTDQQGHWTPANRVNRVVKGGYYGNHMGYHDKPDSSDKFMEQPLVWLIPGVNRSPAELIWSKSKKFGPLDGALLDISYGTGKIFMVPHETLGDTWQGGEYALPLPYKEVFKRNSFPTGVMRGRMHSGDGQLYTCGMFAWAGSARGSGGFYRVRYTGQPITLLTKIEAHKGGVTMHFSSPLETKTAEDPKSYKISTWMVKRTKRYGSGNSDNVNHVVKSAKLSGDKKSVFLALPELKKTWCMKINYNMKDANEQSVTGELHNSIFKFGKRNLN